MNALDFRGIVEANRPRQLELLQLLANTLAGSESVTNIGVRGSLASGQADTLSDVDLVVSIRDDDHAVFMEALDDLMTAQFGALMPGWRDTIVQDRGGIGYVYLLGRDNAVVQVDIYVLRASRLALFTGLETYEEIFRRADSPPSRNIADAEREAPERYPVDLFIEALILGYLLKKRVARSQVYVAYGELHLLNTAAKDLVKSTLAPKSSFHGWYRIEDEVAHTPLGKEVLRILHELIAMLSIVSATSLQEAITGVVRIAELTIPSEIAHMRYALDAYNRYLFDRD